MPPAHRRAPLRAVRSSFRSCRPTFDTSVAPIGSTTAASTLDNASMGATSLSTSRPELRRSTSPTPHPPLSTRRRFCDTRPERRPRLVGRRPGRSNVVSLHGPGVKLFCNFRSSGARSSWRYDLPLSSTPVSLLASIRMSGVGRPRCADCMASSSCRAW